MHILKNSIEFDVCPNVIKQGEDPWLGGTIDYWNVFNSGAWEPETFDVLNTYLSKEHSYIDIGAWVGPTVLYGSQLSKKCYAFEPDPIAFNFLSKNLKANPNITNVELFSNAISGESGKLKLGAKTGQGDSMSSVLWNEGSWEVDAFTLSDFVSRHHITDCNFIKMDIEGGEFAALPAAKNFLKLMKPTLYLSLHTPWFPNKKDFFDRINDVLCIYKNIYASNGTSLSLENLSKMHGFTSIIATDL